MRAFRNYDRMQNIHPKLNYTNMFLLKGGFKHFYENYPEKCRGSYVQMLDQKHILDCSLKKAKRGFLDDIQTILPKFKKNRSQSTLHPLPVLNPRDMLPRPCSSSQKITF